jgi:hypothetical protein
VAVGGCPRRPGRYRRVDSASVPQLRDVVSGRRPRGRKASALPGHRRNPERRWPESPCCRLRRIQRPSAPALLRPLFLTSSASGRRYSRRGEFPEFPDPVPEQRDLQVRHRGFFRPPSGQWPRWRTVLRVAFFAAGCRGIRRDGVLLLPSQQFALNIS